MISDQREAKDERALRAGRNPVAATIRVLSDSVPGDPAFPGERLIASLRLQERHEFE